jgi:cytochrome oxidase assembly protein ShyY1
MANPALLALISVLGFCTALAGWQLQKLDDRMKQLERDVKRLKASELPGHARNLSVFFPFAPS